MIETVAVLGWSLAGLAFYCFVESQRLLKRAWAREDSYQKDVIRLTRIIHRS